MIVVNPTMRWWEYPANGVICSLELKDYQALCRSSLLESCSPYVTIGNYLWTLILLLLFMGLTKVIGNSSFICAKEMFSDQDKMAAQVCVVGQTIVDNLFRMGRILLGRLFVLIKYHSVLSGY
ncbi:MAG: hypothetical protein ACLU4N_17350 [Butyricimonas faecihominis]